MTGGWSVFGYPKSGSDEEVIEEDGCPRVYGFSIEDDNSTSSLAGEAKTTAIACRILGSTGGGGARFHTKAEGTEGAPPQECASTTASCTTTRTKWIFKSRKQGVYIFVDGDGSERQAGSFEVKAREQLLIHRGMPTNVVYKHTVQTYVCE